MTPCANPVCPMPRGRRTRCDACYWYRWKHGQERPAWLAQGRGRRCAMTGCARPFYARNLCRTHYLAWWKHQRARRHQPCANPICPQLAARGARGRCHACHMYLWRHGVERPERLVSPVRGACAASECAQPAAVRGLCLRHYMRAWRAQHRAQRAAGRSA